MNKLNYLNSFSLELERKGYRRESIKSYAPCVSVFLEYFKDRKDPKYINESDIKSFLLQYKTHNTQRTYHSAIKAFYRYVCRQPNKFKYIEYLFNTSNLLLIFAKKTHYGDKKMPVL